MPEGPAAMSRRGEGEQCAHAGQRGHHHAQPRPPHREAVQSGRTRHLGRGRRQRHGHRCRQPDVVVRQQRRERGVAQHRYHIDLPRTGVLAAEQPGVPVPVELDELGRKRRPRSVFGGRLAYRCRVDVVAVPADQPHRLRAELGGDRVLQPRLGRGPLRQPGVAVGVDEVALRPHHRQRHRQCHRGQHPEQRRGEEAHYFAVRRGRASAIRVISWLARLSALSELW